MSTRYIAHLEEENVELKAEIAWLKQQLYGTSPSVGREAEMHAPETKPPSFEPMGGFRPRSALVKSIRMKLADRRIAAKASK